METSRRPGPINVSWRRVLAAAGSVAAAAAITAPTVHAATTIATVDHPTPLSAFAGHVVWSVYDPSIAGYRLTMSVRRVTSVVPVAARSIAFDADIGPDVFGRTTIVYSRCRTEPYDADGIAFLVTARGCDLFQFSLATSRETRIAGASTTAASEYLPTLWRGRVAFARARDARGSVRRRTAQIHIRSLISGRETIVDGGLRSRGPRARGAGPTGMDLAGSRLAFGWTSENSVQESRTHELLVSTLAGASTRVDAWFNNGQFSSLVPSAPALVGARVLYEVTLFSSREYHRFHRYDVTTERYWSSPLHAGAILAMAADARGTYAEYAALGGDRRTACGGPVELGPVRCLIARTDPISYKPASTPAG